MSELVEIWVQETLAIQRDFLKVPNLRKIYWLWILHEALINKVTKGYHSNEERKELKLFIIKDKSYAIFIAGFIISFSTLSYSIIIHNLVKALWNYYFSSDTKAIDLQENLLEKMYSTCKQNKISLLNQRSGHINKQIKIFNLQPTVK